MNLRKLLKANIVLLSLLIILMLFRFSWINALVERDEAVYGYVGMIWSKGYLPYQDIQDNKGPIIYMLYKATIGLFGNSIIPMRIINDVLLFFSVVALYYIVTKWFSRKVALASVAFYGFFMTVPVFQGAQAMPESLSVPFVVFSVFFATWAVRKQSNSIWLFSGVFLAIAALIRQTQVFAAGVIVLILVMAYRGKPAMFKNIASKLLVFAAGILLIASLVFGYLYSLGILSDTLQVMLLGGYHSNYYSTIWALPFGISFLIFVEGLSLWIFGMFGIIVSLTRRGRNYWIVIGWVILSLCSVLMARLFGHNFAQMIVPFSILGGITIGWVFENWKPFDKQFSLGISDKIAKRIIVFLLFLTILPSVFFSAMQYPNMNINWEFIQWNYEDSSTANQQIELANFLIEQNSSFLIDGWTALPYWLSGTVAPLPGLTSTLPHPTLGIRMPEDQYSTLLDMMKKGTFDTIVIYSPNVTKLYQKTTDNITVWTVQNYFYLKSIGNAQVFSKYDSSGKRIDYNFVSNFKKANLEYQSPSGITGNISELNNPNYVAKVVKLGIPPVPNGSQAILQLPLPTMTSRITFDNIPIQQNSRLEFAFITYPATWNNPTGDGVQFEIFVNNQTTNRVFSQYINPKINQSDRKIFNASVDLSDFAGQTVSVVFSTLPGPANNNFDDWAYWINPVLSSYKEGY